MGDEKELLLKKKKKSIESKIEDVERLIEEDSTMDDDLKKKLDALLDVLIQAATEPDEETEILLEIRSSIDEMKKRLSEGIDVSDILESIEKKLNDLQSSLRDPVIREIRSAHDEELLYLSEIKKSLNEIVEIVKEEEKERFEILSRELDSIKDIVDHLVKIIDSDTTQRKEGIEALTSRLNAIEEEIKHLSQEISSEEEEEAIKDLVEKLQKTKDSILYAIAKLEDMEARDVEAVRHTLDDVREDVNQILQILADIETGEQADKEEIGEIEKRISALSKRIKAILSLSTKNSKILQEHAGEIADMLTLLHVLDQRIKEIKEVQEKQPEIMKEYISSLFEKTDQQLASLLSDLRDVLLETLRDRESSLDQHVETLHKSLEDIKGEMANLLLMLKQYDTTSEMKEIEEQIKILSSRVSKGIVDKNEVREALEVIEKRLDSIEKAISTEDLKSLRDSLKKVEESLEVMSKKIDNAEAVITHEDLKQILRDIEEMRVHARLLKDSGIMEAMEELYEKTKRITSELGDLPDKTVHLSEDIDKVEEMLKEIQEIASYIEEIAKTKAESADNIAEHAEKIGKSAGVVGAHIVKKKSKNLKEKSKIMMEISRISRKIEKKVGKVRDQLNKKRLSVDTSPPSDRDHIRNILIGLIKNMKPGTSVDLKAFAASRGLDYDLVLEVAEEIAKVGEMGIRIDKPLLPFLGGAHLRRI